MEPSFKIQYWPENQPTLPPDPRLMKQFKRQGSFNTGIPLPLMRGMVHLATKLMTPVLYSGKFRIRYAQIEVEQRKVGLRIISQLTSKVQPAILYFHGGGGMLTDSSSYIRVMKNIAYSANAAVIGVDYSRAPEHPFPAALNDAVAALQWTYDNADRLGFDKTKISIAGDSAGGNIAAGLSLRNRDEARLPIYKQVLINARLTHTQYFPSMDAFAEGYGLTRAAMKFFESKYFRNPEDAYNAYASPLNATNLNGLPPALIITSEYDPLRDEGEAYASQLHYANVPVKAVRFAGMAHTMVVFGATKPAAADCMKLIAAAVR